MGWIVFFAVLAAFAFWFASWRRRHEERKRAAEARASAFMAQATGGATPDTAGMKKQRLLLEAAAKAGEADEPALAIQLYARFLSRYPDSALAPQARAAVEAQKKSIAKA